MFRLNSPKDKQTDKSKNTTGLLQQEVIGHVTMFLYKLVARAIWSPEGHVKVGKNTNFQVVLYNKICKGLSR